MPLTVKPYFGPKNLGLPLQGGLLIVRHSERFPIVLSSDAYSAGLTENGRRMARAFGEQIGTSWRIGEAVASPAARCVDTAKEIIAGAMNGHHPHPVVRPFPLLHFDLKLSGIPGLEQVYFNLNGFTNLTSRPESPEYVLLSSSLLAELPFPTEPGVINLAVTHDVNITFLKAHLLSWPQAGIEDFPDYLEGICLVKQDAGVCLL
jgi:hypothetical protein